MSYGNGKTGRAMKRKKYPVKKAGVKKYPVKKAAPKRKK